MVPANQLSRVCQTIATVIIVLGLCDDRVWSEDPESAPAAPSVRLTPAEQQLVRTLEKWLSTKLQSPDNNPADQHTWYVLVFKDTATAKTMTTSGTKTDGVLKWSSGTSTQSKTSEDAVMVQGRKEAAIVVGRYLSSPNGAAEKLKASNASPPPGWMKKSESQLTGDRNWDFRAFMNESDAKSFLESVDPDKKPTKK